MNLERFAVVIEVLENGVIETYSGNIIATSPDEAMSEFIESFNIDQENIVYWHCALGID